MEGFVEEIEEPTGQYVNSSSLCVYILGVIDFEVPIDENVLTLSLFHNVFLSINTRFFSIVVTVNRVFLWEIHIINKYPTKNGASTLVFKLHHALGDGYSLMGALLSCLQRVDNPSLPLTFQSKRTPTEILNTKQVFIKSFSFVFSKVFNTISDFGWSVLKSSLVEDDLTPIRSCADDNKFRQMTFSTISFSMDHIKELKLKLRVSINDVLVGSIFFGIRLSMEEMNKDLSKYKSTSLVLMNTRNFKGYKSIKEMVEKNNNNGPWGNQLAFLHIPIPEISDTKIENPLEFIWEAHKEINRKKNSLVTPLNGMLLNIMKKLRGPEASSVVSEV